MNNFNTNALLEQHMKTHSNDGDWCCDDCAHQTNSETNLKNHIEITHHKSHKLPETINENTKEHEKRISCNFCDNKFDSNDKMMDHRRKTRVSFKPCRNMPNCH